MARDCGEHPRHQRSIKLDLMGRLSWIRHDKLSSHLGQFVPSLIARRKGHGFGTVSFRTHRSTPSALKPTGLRHVSRRPAILAVLSISATLDSPKSRAASVVLTGSIRLSQTALPSFQVKSDEDDKWAAAVAAECWVPAAPGHPTTPPRGAITTASRSKK